MEGMGVDARGGRGRSGVGVGGKGIYSNSYDVAKLSIISFHRVNDVYQIAARFFAIIYVMLPHVCGHVLALYK